MRSFIQTLLAAALVAGMMFAAIVARGAECTKTVSSETLADGSTKIVIRTVCTVPTQK